MIRLAACDYLFVECYAYQAFSIAANFNPKLMPKEQNQITMRKVCIVIQSRRKARTWLTHQQLVQLKEPLHVLAFRLAYKWWLVEFCKTGQGFFSSLKGLSDLFGVWCSSRKHGAVFTSGMPVASVYETGALGKVSLIEGMVMVSEVLVAWAVSPVNEQVLSGWQSPLVY